MGLRSGNIYTVGGGGKSRGVAGGGINVLERK